MNVSLIRLTTPDGCTLADEAALAALRRAAHANGAAKRRRERATHHAHKVRDLCDAANLLASCGVTLDDAEMLVAMQTHDDMVLMHRGAAKRFAKEARAHMRDALNLA